MKLLSLDWLVVVIGVLALLLATSRPAQSQSWSGTISTARAIDWTHAGLPATFPDGETTTNPWTPPTRTQCGSTIAAGTSESTIQTAINGCANGTYVLLGAGNFSFTTSGVSFCGVNSVTLRGSGANSTFVHLSGNAVLALGCASGAGQATWASGFSAGATSITMSGSSGLTLTSGNLLQLNQFNTGLSSSGTGTQTDNGGIFICSSPSAACAQQTSENITASQIQLVLVTGVSGNTITISPKLYMPNWASSSGANLAWQSQSQIATGVGLEDMSVVTCESSSTPGCPGASTSANPSAVYIQHGYASWVKGVRMVGQGSNDTFYLQFSKNCLVMNNYIFSDLKLDGNDGGNMAFGKTSDNLILNNIGEFGFFDEGTGGQEGDVVAYNYSINGNAQYVQSSSFQHQSGSSLELHEGNDLGVLEDDDTWGTHNFNTQFRNYIRCWDPPFVTVGSPRGILEDSFSRFANLIGNVVDGGASAFGCTSYESTVSAPLSQQYEFGFYSNTAPSDTLTQASAMLWGNCDAVNGACRFNSGEVPTSLSGNAAPYTNTVPGSHALPCSFFLSGYTSTTCTPHSSGGTGLNFWKVCTSWATFPTSCASSTLQPFPATGPDVTGGTYVNGTAYTNPAGIAWASLPVDTTYQGSYSITNSSWAAGVETLTVSGIPNAHHLMGKFQISGGSCATSGTAELNIIASTGTTVSYVLASNPGSCSGGSFLFPDVRLFDERVFQNDPAGSPSAATPTFSPVAGTYTGTQLVTASTSTSGCGSHIYFDIHPTPTTNQTALSVATSESVYAYVHNCPGFIDSSISSAAYVINAVQTFKFSGTITMTGNGTITVVP